MNNHQSTRETHAEAWQRRHRQAGAVDFTMVYAAHDAFNRDLARMLAALLNESKLSPAFAVTWRTFSKQYSWRPSTRRWRTTTRTR